MRRCPRWRNGAVIFPLQGCRRSTTRLPACSSRPTKFPTRRPMFRTSPSRRKPRRCLPCSLSHYPTAKLSTATTTTRSPPRNRTRPTPACVTTAAWAQTPRNPAVAEASAVEARRVAESRPAPEHQPQLQRRSLGLRYRQFHSRARRQERFEFLLAAGRLHRRLPPLHQHLQRQLEPQQQPHDQLLHQYHRQSRRGRRHQRAQQRRRSTTACPPSRSAMALRASATPSPAFPSRRPSRSPRS